MAGKICRVRGKDARRCLGRQKATKRLSVDELVAFMSLPGSTSCARRWTWASCSLTTRTNTIFRRALEGGYPGASCSLCASRPPCSSPEIGAHGRHVDGRPRAPCPSTPDAGGALEGGLLAGAIRLGICKALSFRDALYRAHADARPGGRRHRDGREAVIELFAGRAATDVPRSAGGQLTSACRAIATAWRAAR